jgi:hypothetical protein
MSYVGFGSLSGAIHLIARLPSVLRAMLLLVVVIVLCR